MFWIIQSYRHKKKKNKICPSKNENVDFPINIMYSLNHSPKPARRVSSLLKKMKQFSQKNMKICCLLTLPQAIQHVGAICLQQNIKDFY